MLFRSTLSTIEVGITGEFPATNITAIVSPIALPTPNTTAASMPDFAAGKVTLNIVSVVDAPRAKDPSLYDAGTAFMAVCETEIMVGSIIIAKTNITASKLCPFGKFKIDWIFGTIKANPNNPYNTDGIPDNNSTAGNIILCTGFGAISAKKVAVKIPIGTPIINEPKVAKTEAAIIDVTPNLSELGSQSVPIIKSIKEYPLNKNGVNPL